MSILQVPDGLAPERVSFLESLFKLMDRAEKIDDLLNCFTSDAKCVLEGRSASGHRELRDQQNATWDLIKSRTHTPQKIYANDAEAEDLMAFGTISYTLMNGTKVGPVGWACRMIIEEDDEVEVGHALRQRISFYQLWMDTALLKEGKAKDAESASASSAHKSPKYSFLKRHATISEQSILAESATTSTCSGGISPQLAEQRRRTTNLGAGPSPLPTSVLETATQGLLNYGQTGMGITELSHRSPTFQTLITGAENNFRKLLGIPRHFKIIFMQGGGLSQFSAVYLNLTGATSAKGRQLAGTNQRPRAEYFVTGSWSSKAVTEAKRLGCDVNVVSDSRTASADGKSFTGIPDASTWTWSKPTGSEAEKPAYIYYCSNETIHGVRMDAPKVPEHLKDVPIVSDMSSNILTEPIDFAGSNYGIIFAGAQKNMGPAGVTVAIIREDLLVDPDDRTPEMLSYKKLADAGSLHNTPPMFSIYVTALMFEEILSKGGVEVKNRESEEKARKVYSAIDKSHGFYIPKVTDRKSRSLMNVVFELKDGKEAEERFVKEAGLRGIKQIKGHRSVGGIRASLYNAVTLDQTDIFVSFLEEFRRGAPPMPTSPVDINAQ